jgi:hypothetical protein
VVLSLYTRTSIHRSGPSHARVYQHTRANRPPGFHALVLTEPAVLCGAAGTRSYHDVLRGAFRPRRDDYWRGEMQRLCATLDAPPDDMQVEVLKKSVEQYQLDDSEITAKAEHCKRS